MLVIDYWAAFLLGLAGSVHCAGMCGPLALALPAAGDNTSGFIFGRLAYNLGRVLTYCLLGVLFGFVGRALFLAGVQGWLSIALGCALIAGLFSSRNLSRWDPVTRLARGLKSRLSALLREQSLLSLLSLGLLNGFLPCGLVYVASAGATATGSTLGGLGYMALFGAGTLPLMLAISLSRRLVPIPLRLKLQKSVSVSICLLAALLILRGMSLGIPYVSPDLSGAALPCCKH